jgi:hypothetical protein
MRLQERWQGFWAGCLLALNDVFMSRPLCFFPITSPAPRSSKSHSATANPLLQLTSTCVGGAQSGEVTGICACVCKHGSSCKGVEVSGCSGPSNVHRNSPSSLPLPSSSSSPRAPLPVGTPGSRRTGGGCAPPAPAAGAAAQSQSALRAARGAVWRVVTPWCISIDSVACRWA